MLIGLSGYYLKNNTREMGNSYTDFSPNGLIALVHENWDRRKPGTGETGLDRKVLVPIPTTGHMKGKPSFFCPARAKVVEGMPLRAEAVCRQEGEEPFVEVFITPEDAAKFGYVEQPATTATVVCYSAEALLENNGTRTTGDDWEIVTLLCGTDEMERMDPLTMARNQLEKVGGTKPQVPYTSDEWALAVWGHKNRGVKVRKSKH